MELVQGLEAARRPVEWLDPRFDAPGTEERHELGQGRQGDPLLAVDGRPEGIGDDDGWRSMRIATQTRLVAASMASRKGPIASMS